MGEPNKPWGRDPDKYPHGTRSRYVAGRCRCEECRSANRQYYHDTQNKRKALALAMLEGVDPPKYCPGVGHPCPRKSKLTKASIGGVCRHCRDRLGWDGLVDASKSRDHIKALSRKGIGYGSVAESAMLTETVVFGIRSGKKRFVKATTERAILEVDSSARAGNSIVPSRPSIALLESLLKKGYSKRYLGKRMGSNSKNPSLPILGRKHITLKSAVRIRKMYDDIMQERRKEREEEKKALKGMKKLCTSCGYSHAKDNRLSYLRRILPARASDIREWYSCFYGDVAGERMLVRDLHEITAIKDGPQNGNGVWSLPRGKQ